MLQAGTGDKATPLSAAAVYADVLAVRAACEAPAVTPLGCPVPDDCRGLADGDDPDVVMITVTGDAAGVNSRGGQVDLLVSETRLGFSDGKP